MKRYFKVYKTLLKLNLANLFAYRINFINEITTSIVFGTLQIIGILILTSKLKFVFGWSSTDLLILVVSFNIFIGFYHAFFSDNFDRFSELMHFGQLDPVLVKPLDSQFLISFWFINYASFIRVIFGVSLLVYILKVNNISINLYQLMGYILLMIIGIVLLYSFWFIVMTLNVWFTRLHNLIDLMFTLNGFTRFPKEMYTGVKSALIYLALPLGLIISTPTKALLGKNLFPDLIEFLIFAILFFLFSRFFWKFALRFYTSAGG